MSSESAETGRGDHGRPTRRALRSGPPRMCAWCTSAATSEVHVPTPDSERRVLGRRFAPACDRHALLHEVKEAGRG